MPRRDYEKSDTRAHGKFIFSVVAFLLYLTVTDEMNGNIVADGAA